MAETDETEIALSVVTIAELERGVRLALRRHPDLEPQLRQWLAKTTTAYRARILPITRAVAMNWGALSAQRSRPVLDTFIAATALVHDLVVVTRNVRDFEDTGVRVLNPWSDG